VAAGPSSNPSFIGNTLTSGIDINGTSVLAPNYVTPRSVQMNIGVQHQLRPGVSISGGYYRNWFGSFLVTDNTLVTPADFDSFCVTAPRDTRLPGGGGYQICGLSDVTPAKFGAVNSVITQSDNFGKMTRVNDFFNVTVNARLARNVQVGGGIDTGRSVNDACFNVDSPGAVAASLPGNLVAGGAGLLSTPTPFTQLSTTSSSFLARRPW